MVRLGDIERVYQYDDETFKFYLYFIPRKDHLDDGIYICGIFKYNVW